MKLGTEKTAAADGRLLVVSRDLTRVMAADGIAATLQDALENWDEVAAPLHEIYEQLNAGTRQGTRDYESTEFAAPLPRAWQWLDGSAFPEHGKLMARAFNKPPIETDAPLMYQGMSHRFLGPTEAACFPAEADAIDFEGEFAVITGAVPMSADPNMAVQAIRLLVQVNDWSLRRYAVPEMRTGFGWILAKPACSMAPVAVTPDELESCWVNNRITATLEVERSDMWFGAVPADEMELGFDDLIVHAARTRDLCAGTIIGSGTVSHSRYPEVGSCCIAERQAIEIIEHGRAKTDYLCFNERVRMWATANESNLPIFGVIDQEVVKAGVILT